MSLRIKRVYSPPEKSDGTRILVDRLWPRGISKDNAKIDEWMKEIAPSNELRQWVHEKDDRWDEFQDRYRAELEPAEKKAVVIKLRTMSKKGTVTLLYAARNEEHNNAVALARIISGKH